MATLHSFNLLVDCLICQQRRVENKPRLLTCKHGFCQGCLTETKCLTNGGNLQCPVCWKMTPLPEGGLKGLPEDNMAGVVEKVLITWRSANTCVLCRYSSSLKEACSYCTDCEFGLCKECAEVHQQKEQFALHTVISDICKFHCRKFIKACITCQIGLCYECVMSEFHGDHDLCELSELCVEKAHLIIMLQNVLQDEIQNNDFIINEATERANQVLAVRKNETEKKIDQHNTQLYAAIKKLMSEREETFHRATTHALERHTSATSDATNCLNEIRLISKVDNMRTLQKVSENTCTVFKSVLKLRENKGCPVETPVLTNDLFITTEDAEQGYIESKVKVGAVVSNFASICGSIPVQHLHLKKLPTEDEGFEHLWSVVATSEDLAVIADSTFAYAATITAEGEELRRNKITRGDVRGLAFHDGVLAIGTANGRSITLFSSHKIREIDLKPSFGNMRAISGLALTDEEIIIVDRGARLLSYSLQGGPHRVLATGRFYSVTIAHYPDDGIVYLVSEFEKNQLQVYKPDGTFLKSIGEMGDKEGQFTLIRDSTVLPNGNILVVDEALHRISEFKYNGTFLRYILTKANGLYEPAGISILYPYLWVVCYEAAFMFKWN